MNPVARVLDAAAAAFAVTTRRVRGVPDMAEWFFNSPFGLSDEQMQHGEAYRKIPIIYALVTLIQNDCAALPRKFKLGDREIDEDRFGTVANVFKTANTRETGLQFRQALFGDLELYGRAHIFLERGRGGRPSRPPYAIWTLHPPSLKVVPGENRTISEYVWTGAGEPQGIEPWKVITIAKYGPGDWLNPTTWVEPAREDWMAQWSALRVLRQFYRRGGISPGTWALDGKTVGRPPDEEQIKAMQAAYARRFQSEDNLWKFVVVDGMKQIEKGMTIGELEIPQMITLANANACRAAGVPPWMMGIKEAGSLDQGKSSETSSENYWRSKIGNLTALVDSVLNEQFCPLFGEGITVETCFDGVPALQAARLEMMKGAVIAAGDSVVAVNEAREWWGEEPTGRAEDDLPRQKAPALPRPGVSGAEPAAPDLPVADEAAARPVSFATRQQKAERLRLRQEARLVREERKMEALWNRIRDEQESFAVSRVREIEERGFARLAERIPLDPDQIYAGVTPEQRAELKRRLEETMLQAAQDAADEIGMAAALDVYAASVQAYIQRRVSVMILHVNETDRARLREQIGRAIAEGKQWREVTELVRDFFHGRRNNSMTIARTETSGPYNRAQFETWKAAGVRRKYWMTVGDEAVRHTHQQAGERYTEEKSIGIDEPFQVGTGQCIVPGETGIPEEDINCRCQVMPDLEQFEMGIAASRELPAWVGQVFGIHRNGKVHAEVGA